MRRRATFADIVGGIIGIAFFAGIAWYFVTLARDPDHFAARCNTYIDYHDGTYGSAETLCDSSKIVSSVTPPALTRGQPDPDIPAIFPSIEVFSTATPSVSKP